MSEISKLEEFRKWFARYVIKPRYISEPTPPEESLQRLEAEYLADEMAQKSTSTAPLNDLLLAEYGISDVSLLPRADLADRIEALIEIGRVQVLFSPRLYSPHFKLTLTIIP